MDSLSPWVFSLLVHDLRTPVTVVSGYVRKLLRESHALEAEHQWRIVNEAARASARLDSIVDALSVIAEGTSARTVAEGVVSYLDSAGSGSFTGVSRRVRVPFPEFGGAVLLLAATNPARTWSRRPDGTLAGVSVLVELSALHMVVRIQPAVSDGHASWHDDTPRATERIEWMRRIECLVSESGGTFRFFANPSDEVKIEMRWPRRRMNRSVGRQERL